MLNEMSRSVVILNNICQRSSIPLNASYYQLDFARTNQRRSQVMDMSESISIIPFIQKQHSNIKEPSGERKKFCSSKFLCNCKIQNQNDKYFQGVKTMYANEKT